MRILKALQPSLTGLAVVVAVAQAANEAPPVPVVVAAAEERLLAPVTPYSGTVISRDDARLAAEVDGRLVWVAEVGSRLKRGQAAARLDDTLFRQEFAEQQATVAREEARLRFFSQEVERLKPLLERKIITPSALDQAISNRDAARGELAVARARVMQTTERLQRTVLTAPFAGVVSERFLQAGERAESGSAILRLVDPHALEVQTRVPASTLQFIKNGMELKLTSGAEQTIGRVHTVVPVGDDRSRLYELRLALAQNDWPAGRPVRVEIPTAAARKVTAVPRDALVLRRDGTIVFRIGEDDKAERVVVAIGIAAGEFIEVRNGIEPGDRVVVRGGERLRSGQKVSVVQGGARP